MLMSGDLIFSRIFSMHRPEALVVYRISKAWCIVSNPLCRGSKQIFIGLPSVINERFMGLPDGKVEHGDWVVIVILTFRFYSSNCLQNKL